MAHKKGGGSTKNTPNRGNAKRLGIKAFDTEFVKSLQATVFNRHMYSSTLPLGDPPK